MSAVSVLYLLFIIGSGGDSLSMTQVAAYKDMSACVAAATAVEGALKSGTGSAHAICLPSDAFDALQSRASGPAGAN